MARNVLVISTVERADKLIGEHVEETDTIKVVVPVVRQGLLDWIANDEKAFDRAEQVAARTGDELPGETEETGAGEANIGLAIRDALATFPADEILLVVRPSEQRGLIESAATDNAPQRSVAGVPVRVLVVSEKS